jgi:hypothetical protein
MALGDNPKQRASGLLLPTRRIRYARCRTSGGIIGRVPQKHTTKALANPAQPHRALFHELERYIEAHNSDVTDVNVLSATDTGQADTSHKPVRHWYQVTYEA